MRESLDPTTPIGRQASDLAQGLRRSLSQDQFHECVWLASIGFGHRFQPVTFTLESRHWMRLDLHGATISYEGRERQFDPGLMASGVVFVSIEHVELMAGESRSTRRHLIEAFMWQPRANESWELEWRLFEVVKTDWIPVIVQPLIAVTASEPPPNSAIDAGRMVRLEVNADGDPEWSVVSGPTPRSGVVESDADRQEKQARRAQELARQAAAAQVDWTRERDVRRAPLLTYADADGCADVFVYGWGSDRDESIAVHADRRRLQLSTTPQTFDLAQPIEGLDVVVHMYERPLRSWPFCTDVGRGLTEELWRPLRGTVTIQLLPGVRKQPPSQYRAVIRLAGAEFVSPTGARVRQVQPIVLTAMVGGVSG
jgi:hypothetical protein